MAGKGRGGKYLFDPSLHRLSLWIGRKPFTMIFSMKGVTLYSVEDTSSLEAQEHQNSLSPSCQRLAGGQEGASYLSKVHMTARHKVLLSSRERVPATWMPEDTGNPGDLRDWSHFPFFSPPPPSCTQKCYTKDQPCSVLSNLFANYQMELRKLQKYISHNSGGKESKVKALAGLVSLNISPLHADGYLLPVSSHSFSSVSLQVSSSDKVILVILDEGPP